MKVKLLLLAIIFPQLLLGCAGNPRLEDLNSEQRAKVLKVQILAEAPKSPYEVIGQVKGLSCHRNAYAPNNVNDEEAMQGVKIRAGILNADAVINAMCQPGGVDFANNCWSMVECVGDAIQFTGKKK